MFSLTLYITVSSEKVASSAMKAVTSSMFRTIANPRRTTLAHLADAEELKAPERPEHTAELPSQTANPRRTVLAEVPVRRTDPTEEQPGAEASSV